MKVPHDIFAKILKINKDSYLVGGSVRDILLDKQPMDFDFAVKGSGIETARKVADEIKGVFVLLSESDDEARVVYKKIFSFDFKGYGRSIREDLTKRDFTINAVAIKLEDFIEGRQRFLDPFGGINHIKHRLIIPVSEDSFKKDPLRVLRAFRFMAETGFEIPFFIYHWMEEVTFKNIAKERIGYEFMRIVETDNSYPVVSKMIEAGVLQKMFPRAERFFEDREILSHSLLVLHGTEKILAEGHFCQRFKDYFSNIEKRRKALIKIAALFHDVAKPLTRIQAEDGGYHFYGHDTKGAKIAEKLAKEDLRLPSKQAESIRSMVERHMHLHLIATAPELTERAIRRFLRLTGEEAVGIMIIDLADGFATAGHTEHLEYTIEKILSIKEKDEREKDFKRLVTGYDLIELGIPPGPVYKILLEELEELQREGKIKTKEEGIKVLKEMIEHERWKQGV